VDYKHQERFSEGKILYLEAITAKTLLIMHLSKAHFSQKNLVKIHPDFLVILLTSKQKE